METIALYQQIISLLIPENILNNFDIVEIEKKEHEFVITLEEKKDLVPDNLRGKEVVLDGFISSLELLTFPVGERNIYLRMHRRRWKEKGGVASGYNEYDFAAKGTKATKPFGDFLKEITG